jgi:hypothetical protein
MAPLLSVSIPRMRYLIAALIVFGLAIPASAQAPVPAERDAVLKTVQGFFDGIASKDVEGIRRLFAPQARFHVLSERDGKPTATTFTGEEFLKNLAGTQEELLERMWTPEVKIRGALATVWTPYDFWRDGKFSHCGVDAFDLIKTDGAWKIAGGGYTVERKCDPSPLGPLKQ